MATTLSGYIKPLYSKEDGLVFPWTHTKAVFNDDGEVLDDIIGSNKTAFTLWDNENPTVTFGSTNITFSRDDYKRIKIFYKLGKSENSKALLCAEGLKGEPILLSATFFSKQQSADEPEYTAGLESTLYHSYRIATFKSDTVLSISGTTGEPITALGSSAYVPIADGNSTIIPVKIIGYNFL